jgi:hypothetical protein
MNGEQRREAVLEYHDTANAAVLVCGRRAFVLALLAKGEATADDVYAAVDLPAGVDPRCLGAVPHPLLRAGIIRAAGFVTSARPERNGSIIRRWELVDRGKAERWIADHPDFSELSAHEKTRQRELPGVG